MTVRVRLVARASLPGLGAARVRAAVARAWELHGGPEWARLEVTLLTAAEHTRIHAAHLRDPRETDVLAFPYGDRDLFGEILVNRDRCVAEARMRRRAAADEALLYVVHGALHLLGLRDDGPAARRAMRRAEARVLRGGDSPGNCRTGA